MAPPAKGADGSGARRAPPGLLVLCGWLALSTLVLASAIPTIDRLGLYYDEAFLAAQARDFVEPGRTHLHPGSVRSVWIGGRPLPLRNAAYLGSLKSQLLIPSLALFGASPRVVRVTTLATGLIGLLFCMLFAARLFGAPTALLGGLLIASDPSFYLFGQFEWGPFTTNLLCRGAGLYLLVLAWQTPGRGNRRLAAAAAGAVLGLGVYSRADFALVLAACGLALLVCHPDLVRSSLRERRSELALACAALALCASPMLLSVRDLLASGAAIADRGDLGFRAGVLWHVLDGSQLGRVLRVGGVFERAAEVTAPAGPFPWLLLASGALIAVRLRLRARHDPQALRRDPRAFLLASSLLLVSGMLLMPGAVRAHHQLNSMPFLQLIVACALIDVLRRVPRRGAARAAAIGLVAAVVLGLLAGQGRVIADTRRLIDETGGRGRFSHALDDFAARVAAEPGVGIVSLDWGFHEPLLFLTDTPRLHEAIWTLPRALQQGHPWSFDGGPGTIYLAHDAPYDLFGLGPDFLASVRSLGADEVEIEAFRDGQGEVAFYAVRITRPHRLLYTGRFQIQR